MGIKITAGRITVDSVVKTIQSAITDLENIATAKNAECNNISSQISALEDKQAIAHHEATRANLIKSKLADLIS